MNPNGFVMDMETNGRLVIPKPIRLKYDINEPGTKVDITDTGDGILIKRHKNACIICGNIASIEIADGKTVCENCLAIIRK